MRSCFSCSKDADSLALMLTVFLREASFCTHTSTGRTLILLPSMTQIDTYRVCSKQFSVFKKNYGQQKEVQPLSVQVNYATPLFMTSHTHSGPAPPLITLTDEGCVAARSLFLTGISVDTLLETGRSLSSITVTGVGHWACVTDDR